MTVLFAVGGAVVAAVAAARSTWSPCGLSMLSTITPLGERGRGRQFAPTAAWFVAGAVAGGLCLGAVTFLLATAMAALHLSSGVRVTLGALACTAVAASDSRTLGFRLPAHGRQVNERWLDQYRPWVYGGGFGWQIGSGLATYVTTGCVYLVVAFGLLAGAPPVALGLGVLFGALRGLAVLLGRRVTSPESLRAAHKRMAELEPVVRHVAIATAASAGVVLWAAAWWPIGAVACAVAVAVSAPRARPEPGSAPTPSSLATGALPPAGRP